MFHTDVRDLDQETYLGERGGRKPNRYPTEREDTTKKALRSALEGRPTRDLESPDKPGPPKPAFDAAGIFDADAWKQWLGKRSLRERREAYLQAVLPGSDNIATSQCDDKAWHAAETYITAIQREFSALRFLKATLT